MFDISKFKKSIDNDIAKKVSEDIDIDINKGIWSNIDINITKKIKEINICQYC